MDQLSAMRAFARVVETGNFTRAATTLSMPKATVTTLIQSLELHLHTKLLNRTTRRVMVTTDGALYYERAVQILSEIEELDGSVSNSQSLPSGRHERYPDIHIDLGVGDRLVDYLAENVDCALRAGMPSDQSLIARRVAEVQLVTCAAPLYIEKFGIPERPEDLDNGHVAVSYFRAQTGKTIPFEFRRGNESFDISPRYILSVNDSRSYVSAAITGLGIVQAPSFMIRDALAEGRLVRILPDWQRGPLPLHIVYPPNRHLSNKVRVFVDWLAKLLVTSKVGAM
jgi:DNA-binding transcriptional LysR family regulator